MTKFKRSVLLMLLILPVILIPASALPQEEKKTETAIVPGDVTQLTTYSNFFYNYPTDDFFYHLNDRLLFMEKPDELVLGGGQRTKLLKIVRWYKLIRKAVLRIKRDRNNMVTIDVSDPAGLRKASVLMNLLGLRLAKSPEGKYLVTENPSSGGVDYREFANLNSKIIQTQLNKTHHLHIKIFESEIPVPWDFQFLSKITRLKINKDNFFETMLKNERFSLLLGVLYHLSDREIQYISSLIKTVRLAAWKEAYRDKKFLMGMFVLADALRLGENGNWVLPGGTAAEDFWTKLVEKNPKESPFGFLYNLAVKDEGKLNYFFLFSTFLPPEKQQALFTGSNAQKMLDLYQKVSLTSKEKLSETHFPGLKDAGFFTLLYSLRMEDKRLYFPITADNWLSMIKYKEPETPVKEITETETAAVADEEDTKDEMALAAFSQENIRRKKEFMRKVRDGVYIKFKIGGNLSDGGDFQDMIDKSKPYYDNLLIPSPHKEFPFFLIYGGEIGITRGHFSFGIEFGNITKSFEVKKPLNYSKISSSGLSTQRLSAMPLLLNIHYTILDTNWFKAHVSGGGGLYFGRYSLKIRYQIVDYTLPAGSISEKAKKTSFGYHLGTTLDFFVSNRLAFFVDARYQLVDFSSLEGSGVINIYQRDRVSKTSYNGELNFYNGGDSGRAAFYIGSTNYDGALEDLTPAQFTLSGFALSLGAKICF